MAHELWGMTIYVSYSYVDWDPFFSFRASVGLEKGFRRERRSAFLTQIDVYQSQQTTSNLG